MKLAFAVIIAAALAAGCSSFGYKSDRPALDGKSDAPGQKRFIYPNNPGERRPNEGDGVSSVSGGR
jgi:hypothetical protein